MHPLVVLGAIGVGATMVASVGNADFSKFWGKRDWPPRPEPSAECQFTTHGNTMVLKNNCTTSETIMVPDGMTLNGRNKTITAVDPEGGGFVGAVIKNEGATAHVKNVRIKTNGLANACKGGDDRLRGILFEGASGSITRNSIIELNKGASGCQEGNGIEVRNAPFDGTHPDTKTVTVERNSVRNYQKTGIIANGDVDVSIKFNHVGDSATEENLAANGIQLGFGAKGDVSRNAVGGNQWCGPSNYAATGMLIYQATDGPNVTKNLVSGNADVGIYAFSDNMTVSRNLVFDRDKVEDCNVNGYDIGIGSYGTGSSVTRNVVKGFDTPTDGVAEEEEDTNLLLRAAAAPVQLEPEPFL